MRWGLLGFAALCAYCACAIHPDGPYAFSELDKNNFAAFMYASVASADTAERNAILDAFAARCDRESATQWALFLQICSAAQARVWHAAVSASSAKSSLESSEPICWTCRDFLASWKSERTASSQTTSHFRESTVSRSMHSDQSYLQTLRSIFHWAA